MKSHYRMILAAFLAFGLAVGCTEQGDGNGNGDQPKTEEPPAKPEPKPQPKPEPKPEPQACADNPMDQSPNHNLKQVLVQDLRDGRHTYSVPQNEALSLQFTPQFDGKHTLGIDTPEGNPRHVGHYFVTVSRCPGEFDTEEIQERMPARCIHTGRMPVLGDKITLTTQGTERGGICNLTKGEQYYVNVRNSRASSGKPTEDSCDKDACKVVLDY